MGNDEMFYPTYSTDTKCRHLTSEEDYNRTTCYPKCSCGCTHCNEYNGYCPIRD